MEPGYLSAGRRVVGGLSVHELRSETGAGTPVVGLHGLGVSTRHLRPALELLALHRPVLALDLPGFGSSERPAKPLGIEALAAFVLGWLRSVGVTRAALLGNSMGCQVAVEVAATAPAFAERLVLVGPTGDPAASSLARQLGRLARDSVRESARLNAIVARDYARAGARWTLSSARLMVRHRIEERLPQVQAPMLLVRGEHDPIAPQPWVERAAALTPHARVCVVPRAAHAAHFTHPHALLELALPFLREEGGEPPAR